MTGAVTLFEGITTGDFGWVRHFGAVSLDTRPIAFAGVILCEVAATIATGAGAVVLLSRLRRAR